MVLLPAISLGPQEDALQLLREQRLLGSLFVFCWDEKYELNLVLLWKENSFCLAGGAEIS